jgi:hypothetical protein
MPCYTPKPVPPPSSSSRSIDFDAIRQHTPLLEFLRSLGYEPHEEGEAYRLPCPLHNEQRGASLVIYPASNRWYCHGKCQRGGDVLDLASMLWAIPSLREVANRLMGGDIPRRESATPERSAISTRPAPKWPERDLDQLDAIVRDGPHLYDAWELSPCRLDGESQTEQIIDIACPGNPWLCFGTAAWAFSTRRREAWRGELSAMSLMVPNPMLGPAGVTRGGKTSAHTLDATAARVYLPIECDFARFHRDGTPTEFLSLIDAWVLDDISVLDACAAVILHLAGRLPLFLIIHSGGKSLHGWFFAHGLHDDDLLPFMRCAVALGADPVTWVRSQLVRTPDARRDNGERQSTIYIDPDHAVLC